MENETIKSLQQEIAELKEKLKKVQGTERYWLTQYEQEERKYETLANAMRGVAFLIDNAIISGKK